MHDVQIYERSSHGMEGRGAGLVAQREVLKILAEVGREDVAQAGVVDRERIFLNDQKRNCGATDYAAVSDFLGIGHSLPSGPKCPYATQGPGILAVGDVWSGSVKRLASGVGEGSVVIAAVHQFLKSDVE